MVSTLINKFTVSSTSEHVDVKDVISDEQKDRRYNDKIKFREKKKELFGN